MASTSMSRAGLARAVGLLALWLALIGPGLADLAVGAVAALLAAWASLRLLPPGVWSPRPAQLVALALRTEWQAIRAGWDVARRALDPRLPLQPGVVRVPTRLAPGVARSAFCALSSLMPGSVPIGTDGEDTLVIHCLDVAQPIAEQMADEEARLVRAFGLELGDG